MSKTSSSNDKQQAPKRVKVTLACVLCRKKKVKCDGVQPSCSRCRSIGNCCQYSEPPKKRGPPKGYVEVIENRAHRIESLLGNQQQQHHYHQQHQKHQTMFNISKNIMNSSSNNSFVQVSADEKNINNNENLIQSNLNQVIIAKESHHQPVNVLLCLIAGAVDAVRETASDNILHPWHYVRFFNDSKCAFH